MIATVWRLSRSDCKILRVTDPYSIHRIVYSLFPKKGGKSRNFLFADKGGTFNERTILILSEEQPEKPPYGELLSKEIPKSFLQQDHYGFEVVINPVIRDSKTGKINSCSRERCSSAMVHSKINLLTAFLWIRILYQ